MSPLFQCFFHYMDVCVCVEYILYPNSVILITFDTYKLCLSECVRISVMAFHNCKIDSIHTECRCSLLSISTPFATLIPILCVIVVIVVVALASTWSRNSRCNFQFSKFYDFICDRFIPETCEIEWLKFFLINILTLLCLSVLVPGIIIVILYVSRTLDPSTFNSFT